MPDASFDILVHGAIGADYLLQLDELAHAGEVRNIESELRIAGGEAVNCARALATWGARVALCGNPLGDDANGRFVIKELAQVDNLTLLAPVIEGFETPYSVMMCASQLHKSRQSRAVLMRNSSARGFDASQQSTEEKWPTAQLATCHGSSLSSAYRFGRQMRERGTTLYAQGALLNEPVARLCEIVTLTDAFWPDFSEELLLRTASKHAGAWNNTVLITRGAQGGVWCRAGEKAQRYDAFCVEDDLLGSVGAGDVFRAGLLWSRLNNYEWKQSIRFASAAAAIKCTLPGAFPTIGQIEAIL